MDALSNKYKEMAGELFYLQIGGNIMDFETWWEGNKNNSRWGFDLECIDAWSVCCPKPTSVCVISVNDELSCICNFVVEEKQHLDLSANTIKGGKSGKAGWRKCAADCCGGIESGSKLFTFPKIAENACTKRCEQWVKYCESHSLESVPLPQLHNRYYLCEKQFYSSSKAKLLPSAVPDIVQETVMVELDESCIDEKRMDDECLGLDGLHKKIVADSSLDTDACANKSKTLPNAVSDIVQETVMVEPDEPCMAEKRMDNESSNSDAFHQEILGDASLDTDVVANKAKTQRQQNRTARVIKRTCSVMGCNSTNLDDVQFHTFPQVVAGGVLQPENVERCKQWLKHCGNMALLQMEITGLHRRHFVCSKHFQDNQYYGSRKRLKSNAVPSELSENVLCDETFNTFPVYGHETDVFAGNPFCFSNGDETMDRTDKFSTILTTQNIKDKHFVQFEEEMANLKKYTCVNCKETFGTRRKLKKPCLHANNCHKFTAANNMDPGEVSEELSGLSYIEEQLIALVHPILSVYKIKGHQFGYRGNIRNFNQCVEEFAKKLPHTVSALSSIITVRTNAESETPQDFHVRANVVRNALLYLKRNNVYYEHIEISEENLDILPEDGVVFDLLPHINVQEESAGQNMSVDVDGEESVQLEVYETGVPINPTANQDDQVANVIDWPTISKEPINEFNTIGYICCAYPCLFPTARADLRQPREVKIGTADYFKHLMRYHDHRFATHPRFRFFAFNSMMRWNAIEKGNLFAQKNSELANMTIDELKSKIKEEPNLLKSVMFQCSNMRGTKPFGKARSSELLEMIEQLGMPTLFFTLTAADLHWPGLFKLLAPNEDLMTMSETRRRILVRSASH